MELKEVSVYEVEMYDLPVREPGEDEICRWFALEVDGKYTAFMEVTESEGLKEISFFIVPDIYKGHGYGDAMLTLYLDQYIPQSEPGELLTACFDYNYGDGDKLASIFAGHGFDIGLKSYPECFLPFETVYNRLASKKPVSYKGTMANLSVCITDVLEAVRSNPDMGITPGDVRESDIEMSVAAIDDDGKLEALMLVSEDIDSKEATVDNLYTSTNDPTTLRKFMSFAVENARISVDPPEFISFVAANKRLEQVMELFFDHPDTSEMIVADCEFNLDKYIEQLKIRDALRR